MNSLLSCALLQGGLTLWPDNRLTPCCLGIYNDLKASTLSMQSNAGFFDAHAWQGVIGKAHASLAQGIIPQECRGCPQLREYSQTGSEIPFFVSVNVINARRCNLACTFCYLKKEFRECDAAFDPHLGMFHDLVGKGLITSDTLINWGGGEPALHPYIKELYALFAVTGCRQHFDTNATIYMDFLENDLASGQTTLSCSLMTSDPETYKQVMGRDLCERAWHNAKRYAATGGDVRAKFIMLPENAGQEQAFVATCKEYGISILTLDREIYTLCAARERNDLIQRAAVFTRAAAALGEDLLNGVSLSYSGRDFLCEVHRCITEKEENILKAPGVKKKHITIRPLGKNPEALAGQVFLLGVRSDIEPIADMRRLAVTESTEWLTRQYSYFSEQYYYFTNAQNSPLSFVVHYRDNLVLRFISHEWSGVASVCIDGEEAVTLDLYAAHNRHVEFDIVNGKATSYRRLF
ncbi:MAG: hypothetical protein DELT_01899 [Desulfovibrio sp.]